MRSLSSEPRQHPSRVRMGGKSEIRNSKFEIKWCAGGISSFLTPHSSFRIRMLSYHLPMTIEVHVRRLPHAEGLPLPSYATSGAAGADDWPTYRGNGFRGGMTRSPVPAQLKIKWQAKLPSRPTALLWRHRITKYTLSVIRTIPRSSSIKSMSS